MLKKDCDRGDGLACVLHAGDSIIRGEKATVSSYKKARKLVLKACKKGDGKSCLHLGALLKLLDGPRYEALVGRYHKSARLLLNNACDRDSGRACNQLGFLWRIGWGGREDEAKAKQYNEKANQLLEKSCQKVLQ